MISAGITYIETLLYAYLIICVGYLALFAFAALFAKEKKIPSTDQYARYLLLIPSYKEDKVILDTAKAALAQDYPTDAYHVLVISDRMSNQTNVALQAIGTEVLKIEFEESSKALAMQTAINHCHPEKQSNEESPSRYDYIIVLDADNIIAPDYLKQVNEYVQDSHCNVLQTHRTAKNLNTPTAILDAVIEEMNNTIFRKGHVQLGLSSALIGSGMVMDYSWFADNIFHAHTAGEDKEFEEMLLWQRIPIHYADHIHVLDEKVQQKAVMDKQRKRWVATQFFLARLMVPKFSQALRQGNWDYVVKTIQSIILPRSILLGIIGMLCLLTTFIPMLSSMKWWTLLFILLITFYIAIPKTMKNKQLYQTIKEVPSFICSMILNLFRSKGASKKFIHTSHGEDLSS